MSIQIGLQWPWAVLLCSMRLLPVLLLTPIMSSFGVPSNAKVLLLLGLSAAMASTAATAPVELPIDAMSLAGMAAAEFATGWLMSLGVHLAFGAVSLAGRLLDLQSGFGLGAVFDPLTKRPASVFESSLGMVAVVTFVTSGMHLALIRLLAQSLVEVPIGSAVLMPEAMAIVRNAGLMFAFGLAFAVPVVVMLLLFDLGLAVLSRSVPQLSVVFLAIGVKLTVALLMLSALASGWGFGLRRIFGLIVG